VGGIAEGEGEEHLEERDLEEEDLEEEVAEMTGGGDSEEREQRETNEGAGENERRTQGDNTGTRSDEWEPSNDEPLNPREDDEYIVMLDGLFAQNRDSMVSVCKVPLSEYSGSLISRNEEVDGVDAGSLDGVLSHSPLFLDFVFSIVFGVFCFWNRLC